ncbi:MAG: bifunctional oligoribonuclease/PAP phosphatase NrnA [Candidatus Berkelbacteria bacterium]|nr:bifunctional oligoribonuclease/PAP phosphatase NrnA [Candidatus Berkelbacteria bacterium]
MELSPKQQVVEVLKSKQKILILTHKNPDGDALGSILALSASLRKLGKEVLAVCNDPAPAVYNFLPEVQSVSQNFAGHRDFVVSLDVSKVRADKIMYKLNGTKLDIIITPQGGQFGHADLSTCEGCFHFEAIVVLDSPDLERLGSPYEKNPEIFFDVPVVNIDHHPGNDQFGKINLVDITATSTAEILVSVIEALSGDSKFINEDIATNLLTGIITDTNSFQNTNTTPKSLTVAAQLVAFGGRQQDIIKNIYKTKPLSTLRLWGRALSNLREEQSCGFVWTKLKVSDFTEIGASVTESSGVIDELLKTAAGVDFALLLTEKNNDVHGSLRSTNRTKDVAAIAKLFGGGGHTMAAAFQIKDKKLTEVETEIISKIKNFQISLKKVTDNTETSS